MRLFGKTIIFVLLSLLMMNPSIFASSPESSKDIFMLFSYQSKAPTYERLYKGIRQTLQSASNDRVEFYVEYMDILRFNDALYLKKLVDLYHHKYSNLKMDLLIPVHDPALGFLLKYGKDLFPGTPTVFSLITNFNLERRSLKSSVTGVVLETGIRGTLDLALKIQRKISHVAIIVGASQLGRQFEEAARKALNNYKDQIEFIYLKGLPIEDLLKKVANLPEHTIVLLFPVLLDRAGRSYIPLDILGSICQASNAPTYSFWDVMLRYGIVGGHMSSSEEIGMRTGELGLRILRGEKPQDIPVIRERPKAHIFDWRQLRRWGIHESDLPPGSIVRYKELSIWNLYRWQIIALVSLCMAEALLILFLLTNRRRRRQADEALRQSEKRLRFMATQLLTAQERESRRISMELHDELGQALMTLKLHLRSIQKKFLADQPAPRAELEQVLDNINGINENVRRLSRDLSPSILADLGLAAALRWLIDDASQYYHIEVSGQIEDLKNMFDKDEETIIFRIFQEALTNIKKHADATRVSIDIKKQDNGASFAVKDDGKGFDMEQVSAMADVERGLGLAAMNERARMVGSSLDIRSQEEVGTKVTFTIPRK